jgi:hypothetical protein
VIFAGSVPSAKNCFRDATLLMEVARLQLAIWYVLKIVTLPAKITVSYQKVTF